MSRRSLFGSCTWGIIKDRCEPALDFLYRHSLAARVILDLIPFDFGHAEIIAFRMADIETRYGRAGPHGVAFGQFHARIRGRVQKAEKRRLFSVIGLGRIARRRTNTLIGFTDQFFRRVVSSDA